LILILVNKGKDIQYDNISDEIKHRHKFKYRFLTQVSTPLYAAPEIVNRSLYTESVDIWGAGVILYLMMFGDIPFRTKTSPVYLESQYQDSKSEYTQIKKEQQDYTVDIHECFIKQIQANCAHDEKLRDLLLQMLAFDSDDRLTSEE
jgi:serine/threonine protein kinase